MNVTCNFSESNINISPFRDTRIYVLLISSCCLRRQKGLQLRVEFTIYMGKLDINIPVEKSNGLTVSFHLGSFREDLRRAIFVLFLVCSADLETTFCGSFSNFTHHFQRDHMHLVYPLPPTMFFITIVSSFFFSF